MAQSNTSTGFWAFYRGAYQDDHKAWQNKALHIFGTLSGLALLAASFTFIPIYWALAFPIVHAVPGLIGHRLFDRNLELGDVRFIGGHYPNLWFMAANHLMTGETLLALLGVKWAR
jgi:hypothetical protein